MFRFRQIYLFPVLCCMTALLFSGVTCRKALAEECNYYVNASMQIPEDVVHDGKSEEMAWNRVEQVNAAMASFVPGDRICFKRGEVFSLYTLLISNLEGTEEQPVVFGAYGNASDPLPILDGSKTMIKGDEGVDGWVSKGNNLYTGLPQEQGGEPKEPHLLTYNEVAKPPLTILKLNSTPAEISKNTILLLPYGNFWVTSRTDSILYGVYINITPDLKDAANLAAGQEVASFRYVVDGQEIAVTDPLEISEVVTTGAAAKAGLTEPGQWYWDTTEKVVYLYANDSPTNDTVKANWVDFGIRVEPKADGAVSQHIILQDLKIQNFNKQGLVLYNSLNITAQRLHIFANTYNGIQMWNTSESLIEDNIIDSNTQGIYLYTQAQLSKEEERNSIYNQIRNNSITNNRAMGIGLACHKPAGELSGNVISSNTITGSNAMTYGSAGIYTSYAGSNTIKDNVVSNGGSTYLRSTGIMVDQGGDAMTITGNTIENNSSGGIAVTGNGHQIKDNTLRNNGVPNMQRPQIEFFGAKFNTGASNCTVTGNVMEVLTGSSFIKGADGSDSDHTIDYNNYSCKGSNENFLWPTRQLWMDFPTWQSESEHDVNSTYRQISSILLFLNGWIRPRD